MFLSCEKSSKLIIQKDYEHIAWHEQLQLFHHYLICVSCRRFAKQHKFLREQTKNLFLEEDVLPDVKMTEEKKQEIQEKMFPKDSK
jgi:hypothetical protein